VSSYKKAPLAVAALSMTSIALAAGAPSGTGVAAPATTTVDGTVVPVNLSDYELSCETVSGKIDFSPGLTSEQPYGQVSLTAKIKATNCTASPPPAIGGPAVTIPKVTLSGGLTLPYGARCAGNAYRTLTGGLTATYKTAHGIMATSGPAQVVPGSWSWDCASTGTLSVTFPAAVVGVSLPAVQVTGSFAGTDGGASSKIVFNGCTFSSKKLSSASGVQSVKCAAMPGNSLFLG
jgi:hypothetical protein